MSVSTPGNHVKGCCCVICQLVEQASVTDAVKLSGVGERHQLPGKARQQGSEGTSEREAAMRTLPTDCIPETAPDQAEQGRNGPSIHEFGVGDAAWAIAHAAITEKWSDAKLGPEIAKFALEYAREAQAEASQRSETPPDVRPGIVAAINYCLSWYRNRHEPGFLNVALELQNRLKGGTKVFEEAYARAEQRSETGTRDDRREELRARIIDYLQNGGLFNPEMMEHIEVRNLLIDCRDYLGIGSDTPAPRKGPACGGIMHERGKGCADCRDYAATQREPEQAK